MTDQDTWLCVMQPSSGAQDTVCYLHKPTYSTKITRTILIKITSYVDALESHYLTYQI